MSACLSMLGWGRWTVSRNETRCDISDQEVPSPHPESQFLLGPSGPAEPCPAHRSNPNCCRLWVHGHMSAHGHPSRGTVFLPSSFFTLILVSPSATKGHWGEGGRVKWVESIWLD